MAEIRTRAEIDRTLQEIRKKHGKEPARDNDAVGVKAVNNDRYPAHCAECDSAEDEDFTLEGGDFYSYKETCKKIKKFGVLPEEHPSPEMMDKLQKIIKRCMKNYTPADGELSLRGIYLYRETEQVPDLQCTFGYTEDIENGEALIGLSYSLLSYAGMDVFHDLVFLHECSHLAEMNHGEDFQNRFNEVEFDYYFFNNVHLDARTRHIAKGRGWKM